MKAFSLDLHHIVLYGLLLAIGLGALSVVHEWKMDVQKAQLKSEYDAKAFAAAEQAQTDRAKQFEAQLELLRAQRVTVKTPAPVRIQRLQGLEPEMQVLPDQLIAPKPDAPKEQLVLEPAQQVTLINRLIDCKACENERDKLRLDLVDESTKRQAAEQDAKTWKEAAKGGSLWTRLKRRAWHFAEDALVIEVLRCAGGHC